MIQITDSKAESYLFYRNIRSAVLNRSKYGKTHLLPFKYSYSRYKKRKNHYVFNVFTQVDVKQLTDFLRTVTAASDLVDYTLVNLSGKNSLRNNLLYACVRSIKYNILVFNWCKNRRPRLARFSVIDVTKFLTKLFYLHVLSCYILKSTFSQLFLIPTHVLIIASQSNNQEVL